MAHCIRNENLEKFKSKLTDDLYINYQVLDRDAYDFTLLMTACQAGKKDICEYLISKGADLELTCIEDQKAILFALRKKNLEIYQLLIDAGANIDCICTHTGYSVLTFLCEIRNIDIKFIEHAINNGCDINHGDNHGVRPIMTALYSYNFHVFKYLIEKGADLTNLKYILKYKYKYMDEVDRAEICEILKHIGYDEESDCREPKALTVTEKIEHCAGVKDERYMCLSLSNAEYWSEHTSGHGYALFVNKEMTHASVESFNHNTYFESEKLFKYEEIDWYNRHEVVYSGPLERLIELVSEKRDLVLHDRTISCYDYDYRIIREFYNLILKWYYDERKLEYKHLTNYKSAVNKHIQLTHTELECIELKSLKQKYQYDDDDDDDDD